MMLQIAIGFLVALLSLIFASKMYASGQEDAAKQCDAFGAFEVSGIVYQCSKRESKMNQIPANWPFPIVNGVRTPESQALIDSKTQPASNVELERKQVLAEAEEALF